MRRNKAVREAFADEVVEAALRLTDRSREARDVFIGNEMFSLPAARVGDIQLLYMPPAALGFHVVDIWAPIKGRTTKVFSAQWRPFHIVTFLYGPWVDLLVPGSRGHR